MKVISRKQIPTQPHWGWKALTAYLALEHFNAPGWVWVSLVASLHLR